MTEFRAQSLKRTYQRLDESAKLEGLKGHAESLNRYMSRIYLEFYRPLCWHCNVEPLTFGEWLLEKIEIIDTVVETKLD